MKKAARSRAHLSLGCSTGRTNIEGQSRTGHPNKSGSESTVEPRRGGQTSGRDKWGHKYIKRTSPASHGGPGHAEGVRYAPRDRGEVGYKHECRPPICPTCHALVVRRMTPLEREQKEGPPRCMGLIGAAPRGNAAAGLSARPFREFYNREYRYLSKDERRRFFW